MVVHIPARRRTHGEPRTSAKVSFPDLMAALDGYHRDSGQQPLMLGGWDVEDRAIRPPAALEARLCSIAERPRRYTYTKDFRCACERAVQIFARSMSFGGRPLHPENVSILHNSTQGLLLALAALKEQGIRRIVVATPVYFAAIEACRLLSINAVLIPAAEYLTGTLDLDRVLSELRVPHSALLLTNPAYSLGVQHRPESLAALFAALPQETWVLLDETRLGLHWHDPLPWYSASFPERTLVLRSPSKIFFTNGLKTSLIFGPSTVLRSVERLADVLVGSAPGNAEFVALAYLDAWSAWATEARMHQRGPFQTWRAQVVAQLRANLGRIQPYLDQYGLLCSPIDSGPHLLAAFPHAHEHNVNPIALARHEGVHVMMSSYFFHESDVWSGFRINLGGDAARTRVALLRVFTHLHARTETNLDALPF